jgi:hypothetical protein
MCDGRGRILCIIREKEKEWLFGGFTSIPAASPSRPGFLAINIKSGF